MILRDKLLRIYPTDETIFGQDQREEELHETMNEALERHFNGIHFRERNSGSQIDEHMRDSGFNMDAYVDLETGFIMGGNGSNCGTWMDKMGSSDRAGNRGEPATPRDGAAVELQGLAYHVLIALSKCSSFPRQSIKNNEKSMEWSLEEWAKRIEQHFQACFYVDEHDEHPLIHRRGIVKDSFGSSAKFTDFQLRPNCAIALTLAPTLLDADKAWNAIKTVDEILCGPLGVKTLDPKDWNYHGFYNNDDDSITKKTAKGFNYHQGPEWLWVSCYVMRAQLAIAVRLRKGNEELWQSTLSRLKRRLGNFWQHIEQSIWRSLPELTQENGIECPGSCPAQAWSVGCLLELLHDLHRYGQEEEEISTRLE